MAPSSLSSLVAKAQSVKVQTLATLMSALSEVQGAAGVGANEADNPQARLQSAEAAVKATIISIDAQGRAILDVGGAKVEARLPQELLNAAGRNPDLLRPGAQLRLPPDVPARILPPPATRVEVHGQAQGTSVGPAASLASPFPQGSLGAAISKLAGLALPGAEPQVTTTPPGTLPPPPPHAPTLRPGMVTHAVQPEILTALVQAAGRQVPLAQGLNFLLSLPPEALKSLPNGVQDIIKTIAQMRAAPGELASPEGLAKAVANSGVFLEAHLAGKTAPQADFKALLLNLKALLGGAGQPQTLPPAPGTGGLANAAALLLGDAPEVDLPTPAQPPAQSDTRHAPPAGQRGNSPATPALQEIQRAVDGSVERIKLSQLASLPERPEIRVTDDRAQPLRLAVSLPLAPQGQDKPTTAVMGMVIEHRPVAEKPPSYELEDEGESPETAGFPWKVRIALDLEETGPVQAEIALRGQSVGVTLWAERPVMAEEARREIGALHRALTKAAFEVVNLEVKDGFPHNRRIPQSPVLDRRT
ncbi:MAG: flagellar hook-length control protein FliK [Proteobacteria bacterium]|nr:flagellar hook-length control protein FliK [Pseudomonadota bacterium]